MSVTTGRHCYSRPNAPIVEGSTLARFATRIAGKHGVDVADYGLLHSWTVREPEVFWAEVWD